MLWWFTPVTFATPKSASFTCASQETRTFDGFTSRWITGAGSPVSSVAACAAASASKMHAVTCIAVASSNGRPTVFSIPRSRLSGGPPTYSRTITSWSPLAKKS